MGTNYVKKARTVRLPAVSDLQINSFNTGIISVKGSYIKNGAVFKYPDGRYYVMQRPSFAAFNRPSDSVVTKYKGRGIYYWSEHSDRYFVNEDQVYKGDYGSPCTMTDGITAGTEKIEIAELGDDLIFVNAEGNEVRLIRGDISNLTVIAPADDSNIPASLAHGIVVLDQTAYILGTDGVVYGSALGNADDWSDTLNFISAEKEEDGGVYIDKHHDQVVVFGKKTIEFFYNAGNTTGSPLSRREDISYNIGCADANSVWRNGDEIYFLGIDNSGQVRPYLLKEFNLQPISNTSLTSFLTGTTALTSKLVMGSGISAGENIYYILTLYDLVGGLIDPSGSYVYNSSTQFWTEWEFAGTSIDNFPMVSFSISDSSNRGEGILSNGYLIHVVDNYTPYDKEANSVSPYVASGYVGDGYVLAGADGSSAEITLLIRLDNFDSDSRDWKFAHQLRYVGDSTTDSNIMTIRWNDSDNVPDTYTGTRTINLNSNLNKLTRLGRFKSRSFEFEYSGTEQIRFEAIDLDITEGTH